MALMCSEAIEDAGKTRSCLPPFLPFPTLPFLLVVGTIIYKRNRKHKCFLKSQSHYFAGSRNRKCHPYPPNFLPLPSPPPLPAAARAAGKDEIHFHWLSTNDRGRGGWRQAKPSEYPVTGPVDMPSKHGCRPTVCRSPFIRRGFVAGAIVSRGAARTNVTHTCWSCLTWLGCHIVMYARSCLSDLLWWLKLLTGVDLLHNAPVIE